MRNYRIEIIVKDNNLDVTYIRALLINYFDIRSSPSYPVYVDYKKHEIKTIVMNATNPMRIDIEHHFIVKVQHQDKDVGAMPLATISMQAFPPQIVVFIDAIPEPEVMNKNKEIWIMVQHLAREITSRMEILKFEIVSVTPPDSLPKKLMPQNLLPPWEQIPENGRNREVLRLWHSGLTGKEIGNKLGLEPDSVTNIISRLRGLHGTNLVPMNEERKRRK